MLDYGKGDGERETPRERSRDLGKESKLGLEDRANESQLGSECGREDMTLKKV